jgi:hypothetical protein
MAHIMAASSEAGNQMTGCLALASAIAQHME